MNTPGESSQTGRQADPSGLYGPRLILWLMNHTEMPLANLIGHGDVAARSLDEVRAFCDAAGLEVEKLERAKKFRLHLVARKVAIEKRRDSCPLSNQS